MDQDDDMYGFFDNSGQDVSLVADNHLFNNGPDLFEDQILNSKLMDTLGESMASPRPINTVHPFADVSAQGPSSGPSTDGDYFSDLFNFGEYGDATTAFADFQNQPTSEPVAQQFGGAGMGLTFDRNVPHHPVVPTPTVASTELFNNTASYLQFGSAHTATFNDPTSWSLVGTNSLPTIAQQQEWSVLINPVEPLQPQPDAIQMQYMQAVRQMQIAENQAVLSMQPPFQSPVNVQTPQNVESSPELQSLQNPQEPQGSSPPRTVSSGERRQPIKSAEPNAQTVAPPATSDFEDQEESSRNIPGSCKARTKRTAPKIRTIPSAQDDSLPQAPYGRLTFKSLGEAEAAMPSRYMKNEWVAPSPDNTVPHTHQDRAYWVILLLDAMQDTSECKDNQVGFSFVKRWRDGGYYNEREMEKVCWYMVDVAERLHAHGPSILNIYCEDALKKIKASRVLTFEQRIISICDMLKLSKFLCDSLMKGEGIEALVGAPRQKMSGAKTMMMQNKKRQKWLESGRKGDPLHRLGGKDGSLEPEEQDNVDDTATDSQPPQRKPKHNSKGPISGAKPRAKAGSRSRAVTRGSHDENEDSGLSRRQSVLNNTMHASRGTFPPMLSLTSAPALSQAPPAFSQPKTHAKPDSRKHATEKKQADRPAKRARVDAPRPTSRKVSPLSSAEEDDGYDSASGFDAEMSINEEQDTATDEQDGESEEQPTESEDDENKNDEDETSDDEEEDEEEDEDQTNESDLEQSPTAPSASTTRKRKRDSVLNGGPIIRTSPRVVIVQPRRSNALQEPESENNTTRPTKRAKKCNNEPARKSASLTKKGTAMEGTAQRDNRGRVLRRGGASSAGRCLGSVSRERDAAAARKK